jgi:hypothetical protein
MIQNGPDQKVEILEENGLWLHRFVTLVMEWFKTQFICRVPCIDYHSTLTLRLNMLLSNSLRSSWNLQSCVCDLGRCEMVARPLSKSASSHRLDRRNGVERPQHMRLQLDQTQLAVVVVSYDNRSSLAHRRQLVSLVSYSLVSL